MFEDDREKNVHCPATRYIPTKAKDSRWAKQSPRPSAVYGSLEMTSQNGNNGYC